MIFPTIVDPFEDCSNKSRTKFETNDVRTSVDVVDLRPPLAIIGGAYPRISEQITKLWGTYALQLRFTRWLLIDQEGRTGWPKNVREALFYLSNNHADLFGFEVTPIWDGHRDTW